MAIDTTKTIAEVSVNGVDMTLKQTGGGSISVIRVAELPNTSITLSKDGQTIETLNTGESGGEVDFSVDEIGTYNISATNTNISWNKDVVVDALNITVIPFAGSLDDYSWEQIHEACQGGYASLMWKPKMQKTYVDSGSIYNNLKIMIIKITLSGGKNQIKWCLANRLSTGYNINPKFGYLSDPDNIVWFKTYSNNGGMKYSAMEQRFKVQGEEVYSQAQGILPEDYSGTLETGVKPSELCYTDQNGALCKVYDYDKATDSFTEAIKFVYINDSDAQPKCKFIKGYFKSVGAIDVATFNSGYYYTYDSTNFVYTRATTYTSETTYYGLYETLQEDGVFIAGLSAIRQYLVKEERKASAGGSYQRYLSSFTDYANLLAVEEITGLYIGLTLPSGMEARTYNIAGEGEKEEGFDFKTQTTGSVYWTRSSNYENATNFCSIIPTGGINSSTVYTNMGVRVGFTTL